MIELQFIEQIVEPPVLGDFLNLDVVLLKTMKCQLGLIVDKDFKGLERNKLDEIC